MNKNLIWLAAIFLLLGVIAGMVVKDMVSIPGSTTPTGKAVASDSIKPEIIPLDKLDINNLNKITIPEDNVVCYIKVGQAGGISCVKMQE